MCVCLCARARDEVGWRTAIVMVDKSKVTRAFIAHSMGLTRKDALTAHCVSFHRRQHLTIVRHAQSYTFCNFVNKRAHK